MSAEQREEIELIRAAGHRMLGMIELSLDLFKMETGQLNYSASRVDLIRIVQDVCASIAQLLSRKQLGLAIRHNGQPVSPEKPDAGGHCVEMIAADAQLLLSMLGNLLTNAVEASPPGATIGLDIQVNDWVVLDICNRGAVPPPMREHFFEKYRTHGKPNGTGLGTYSAKLMADTMGMDLTMSTSDAEDRTCIHLRMPLAAATAATMGE